MVYYTGDTHGSVSRIIYFSRRFKLGKEDTIVILGDVGANFFGNKEDIIFKKSVSKIHPTVFCVHGNHENRPEHISTYKTKEWNGGIVWYEEEYPNLLFAKDGEIYEIEGKKHIVIGGAYSVDKDWRIKNNIKWWEDEQPSDEIKRRVEQQLSANSIDIILSHTCPYNYIPHEVFLPDIDQSMVDNSTEKWLETIERKTNYKAWYCGHWHTDKRIDKMHFLFHGFESMIE